MEFDIKLYYDKETMWDALGITEERCDEIMDALYDLWDECDSIPQVIERAIKEIAQSNEELILLMLLIGGRIVIDYLEDHSEEICDKV